jgi:hypothetical protein
VFGISSPFIRLGNGSLITAVLPTFVSSFGLVDEVAVDVSEAATPVELFELEAEGLTSV